MATTTTAATTQTVGAGSLSSGRVGAVAFYCVHWPVVRFVDGISFIIATRRTN